MWYYEGRDRIEPDWNVNTDTMLSFVICGNDRIEPDWNVNVCIAHNSN